MQKRQQFTAEFKREAVRLLKAGDRPAAVVARELGIPRNRLYKWAQDLEKNGTTAFAGSGRQGHPQFCDLNLRGQAWESFPLGSFYSVKENKDTHNSAI